jgi:hypothetical protein
LKTPKINRRFVLSAVLALAIIGMFLVPAASVSAAPPETQDWPLRLVGATNVNLTKAQFETMAAANPSENWTDSNGNVFKGVAMWRLVALVDDGDPATFNDALASVYSIKFTGLNNDGTYYVNTYAPPFTAIPFPHAENVFVANKVMLSGTTSWVDLPLFQPGSTSKLWYPCAIRGAGTTGGGTRTSALVQIELLNLTVTAVSVSPASQSVANGATFTVDLAVDTDTASRGWQTNVDFDATKMQCTGVTEGGFLKDWATAHSGSTIAAPGLAIDNVNGHVTSLGYAILGGDAGGPSGAGTLCTLSFTASTSVNDFAGITPSGVVVSDANAVEIPGVVVTGGSVLIGTEPKPDLVVTQKHEDWAVAGSTYTINYTVKNQGNAAAGASTTSIVIDGGAPITVACPALAAGATDTQTTGVQSFSAPTDTIVVTADSAGVVTESNETNNARQNMLSYYGALAGVAVEVTGESYTAHASVVNELVNPAVSYDPLTFMVKVTNTGLLDDKYELTVTDEQGWTLKLDPSELFVMAADPDDAGYAALSVSVPQDTAGNLSDQITVTATGKMATNGGVVIGPVGQATITVTTQALNSVQIELLPGTNEPQTGAPDSPISWLVVVKNTGNVADTFDVAVAESVTGVSSKSAARTSWGASFSAEPGVLPAFTKWASYLKVTVPADAKTSEWNQLTVTITGIGGSSDTYVVKAHVLEPGPQIPEGVVEVTVEDEIVSISCLGVDSYPFGVMGEGESKATAEDFFVIRNTGNVDIDISVRGQDALSMPGEPSAKWVLTNSPNLDEYSLQLNPETAAFGGADTDLITGDQWIWAAVPESQEVFYGLTLSTPTAVTTPARMWMRITISAIAS